MQRLSLRRQDEKTYSCKWDAVPVLNPRRAVVETVLKKPEEGKAPASDELAQEARKWLEPPPKAVEPEQLKPAPDGVRSVRYDLD